MQKQLARIRFIAVVAIALAWWSVAKAANADHVATFKRTHACESCDLSGANLAGTQAPGAKLSNANLANASFYGSDLRGAELSGAMLDGANFEMVNLTGAVGAVLGGAKTDSRTICPDGKAGPCQ